jgi:hypothetical protein
MLLRYEDMMTDVASQLWRLLAFLRVSNVKPAIVDRAVALGGFESMRGLEKRDELRSGRLRPANRDDPNSFKVRRGKVGGFGDYLDSEDLEYVNAVMKSLDPWFGYDAEFG